MALRHKIVKSALSLGASVWVLSSVAFAQDFAIPGGDLQSALANYSSQTGVNFVVSSDELRGVQTKGVRGNLSADDALSRLLRGTGFEIKHYSSGKIGLSRGEPHAGNEVMPLQLAQAASPPRAAVETVTVTSSKLGGADVQSIPIAITALSQEQLTATQTAGGPDLVKQVPNLTFTKTNFSGYSIQIRGIGTQAISVSTDPAVAVALNDISFIRNHFFEQEFYDLGQAEVLRGPQGTLYGRNATAGVVNLVTAKPSDQFEAMASGEIGNYHQRRFEGMINLPIVDDRLDVRLAGEWTKRQGYSFNELTDQRIDGRDLWSGRLTIGFKPFSNVQTMLVWEHFSEDDDRLRTSKQLCKTDPIISEINGVAVNPLAGDWNLPGGYLSQGCRMTSLYSQDAFEVPNGFSLPYFNGVAGLNAPVRPEFNPYSNTTQSTNLRVIETTLNPTYKAKNDILEFNADYSITPQLALTSQTGYSNDFLWSTEDYNRFDTQPGAFIFPNTGYPSAPAWGIIHADPNGLGLCATPNAGGTSGGCANGLAPGAVCNPGVSGCVQDGVFCDPQLGCSDRLVAQDLSEEHSWQISQEFRLSSHFNGPFNFSLGGNFLHYETEENYYVFVNTLTMAVAGTGIANDVNSQTDGNVWIPGVSDNHQCLTRLEGGFVYHSPAAPPNSVQSNCSYIDPNPISTLNGQGHNYFLSQNPYVLNSYAGFGEAYYDVLPDLKLTAGLRWTDDRKHFVEIPSELIVSGYGYPSVGTLDQRWSQWTGRFAANWAPKLDFTDQTMLYGSFAHGYKAGGANPPGAVLFGAGVSGIDDSQAQPDHPLSFKPEFINAYELGTKNTLLDGALTFNANVFYYDYKDYQISEIVDRSAINLNFSAHVKGAEIESTYEPLPGLRFNFAGGWEDTALAQGSKAIDLMDRTAGDPNWLVVKPFVTLSSNCILPAYVVLYQLTNPGAGGVDLACGEAYINHNDPVTLASYVANPTVNAAGGPITPGTYLGFDPLSVDPNAPANVNNGLGLVPNSGEGIDKNLSGNKLPNAPPFTVSAGAQYTIPLSSDWAGTVRADYYWQDYSWARVFNDNPYDRLRGYTNANLTLIFTNQNGWQVMLYDKNVFNTTAITGDFLNSDDSGLTTNVFLTDPKLIGVRVTKNW